MLPKVSVATETVRSKDDSNKENVHLLPDESIRKGEFVGGGPSNTVRSLPKGSPHSCDRPLAERAQVAHSENPCTAFLSGICICWNILFSTKFNSFVVKHFISTEKLQGQNCELSYTLYLGSQFNVLPHLFSIYMSYTHTVC